MLKKILTLALLSTGCLLTARGFDGLVNVPDEIKRITEYCTVDGRAKFDCYGAKPAKGVLLVAATGCGKTSIAKAMSEIVECPFAYINADLLADKDIPDLFKTVREGAQAEDNILKKAILFLDQFDNISKSAELLEELDGYSYDDSVIVIAAVPKLDAYNESLVRSGRLDTVIKIVLPDLQTRIDLLQRHCQIADNMPAPIFPAIAAGFSDDLDLEKIAKLADSFSPADIREIVRQARLHAVKDNTLEINNSHLFAGFKEVLNGKGLWNKDLAIKINAIMNSKNRVKGFDAVIGGVATDIQQLADQINGDSKFDKLGIAPPKGVLLTGPPGTGKTSLARALAEETGCAFVAISGGEVNGSIVGSGANKIRQLFEDARSKAATSDSGKAIVFIDEIDALGKRGGNPLDATINQLLTEMDGFAQDESIVVIGATNHPKNVDDALLRAGRLSKTIRIGLPSTKTREELARFYLGSTAITDDVDLKKISEITSNFTPADIKELIDKAKRQALDENTDAISQKHLIHGIRQAIREKQVKGDPNAQQMLDALEVATSANSQKGFAALAGGVPEEIQDLLDEVKGNVDYSKYNLPTPKGFLLVGPPGTGKTALVRAVAEESGFDFVVTKGSDFINQFVGVGAQAVRDKFDEARSKAEGNRFGKCILFIDEIDAIASRGGHDGGESRRTLIELLGQIDGFSQDDSVIVMGATNDPASVDAALKRAGRLDTTITIGLPDKGKIIALFELYAKKIPLGSDVDFAELADCLNGVNAADVKNIVITASRAAAKEGADVSMEHFEAAIIKLAAMEEDKNERYI